MTRRLEGRGDASVYLLDVLGVIDGEKLKECRKRVPASAQRHGGWDLAIGGTFAVVEGSGQSGMRQAVAETEGIERLSRAGST